MMTERAAGALAWGFQVWPSFGGSVLLVSALVGVALLALTARAARAGRTMARLQPDIEAIQRRWQGDSARLTEELSAFYRRQGVNPLRGCLPFLVASVAVLAGAALMLQIVIGVRAFDGAPGERLPYFDPSSQLSKALVANHGHLPWMGIDLVNSAATFQKAPRDAAPYLVLPTIFALLSVIRRRTAPRPTAGVAGRGAWALAMVGSFVFGLFLPAAVLLFLATTALVNAGGALIFAPAGRGRRRRRRRRDRPLAVAPPRPASRPQITRPAPPPPRPKTAWETYCESLALAGGRQGASQRGNAAEQAKATRTFLRHASQTEVAEHAAELANGSASIAAQLPSDGAALFTQLARRCPGGVGDHVSTFLKAWMTSPCIETFTNDWSALKTVVAPGQAPAAAKLSATVRSLSIGARRSFTRQATEHFLAELDASMRIAGNSSATPTPDELAALELIDTLAPGRRLLTRGDVYGVLGDMAAERRDHREAMSRYQTACAQGCEPAQRRLAHAYAAQGHRLLLDGQVRDAVVQFDAATSSAPDDAEYKLLAGLARLLADQPGRITQQQLKALAAAGLPRLTLAFWSGVAYLLAGKHDRAASALRPVVGESGGHPGTWDFGDEAAVLVASIEDDDETLVECARKLVRTHGESWTTHGPADPWPVLAAACRHDEALFLELLSLVDGSADLPDWALVAGARAALEQGVALAAAGDLGGGKSKLNLADRLLAQ